MGEWKIEEKNAVGPGYREWWEVSNGERTFKCESKADAEWLQGVLSGKLMPHQL